MYALTMRALLIFSLLLSGYGYYAHGWAGLICGFIIGTFLLFGIVGIVVTDGSMTGGLGALFAWFVGFVFLMMGMFWVERFVIDGGPIPGKTFGPPGGMYMADKVMVLFGQWVSFHSSPGDYSFMVVYLIVGFVLSALLSSKN